MDAEKHGERILKKRESSERGSRYVLSGTRGICQTKNVYHPQNCESPSPIHQTPTPRHPTCYAGVLHASLQAPNDLIACVNRTMKASLSSPFLSQHQLKLASLPASSSPFLLASSGSPFSRGHVLASPSS